MRYHVIYNIYIYIFMNSKSHISPSSPTSERIWAALNYRPPWNTWGRPRGQTPRPSSRRWWAECGPGIWCYHPESAARNGANWCILRIQKYVTNIIYIIHYSIINNMYICISYYLHMGADQNKGIWGSYNRRSTANQPRSQRCRGRVLSYATHCDTILRRESSKHCYTISQHLETWREPGPTQAALTIADQPRTNRGFHRHFLKIELIWVVRLWTCCSDSSLLLAITIEHSV